MKLVSIFFYSLHSKLNVTQTMFPGVQIHTIFYEPRQVLCLGS
jgi:hypothetical protein